jgi:hypothetical protein
LVAGEKDPLALFFAQTLRSDAAAAFTAIQTVPIIRKLSPLSLQGGEPHAQQSRHLTGPSPGRHSGIEDLQGLAAISRRGQCPSSSPQ